MKKSEIWTFTVGILQGCASSAPVSSLQDIKTGWGSPVVNEAPTEVSYLEKLDKGIVNNGI